MSLHRKLSSKLSIVIARRYYAASPKKLVVQLHSEIDEKVTNNEIKIRKHPGRMYPNLIVVPKSITDAILESIGNTPIKALLRDAQSLINYIRSRRLPAEQREVNQRYKELAQEFEATQLANMVPVTDKTLSLCDKKVNKKLKEEMYAWQALVLGEYESIKYMVGRGPANYAVLYKIFNEIKTRGEYTPTTFFDFGSGIGTGIWTLTDCWKAPINEYYTVDVSQEVQNLARDLLFKIYDKKTVKEDRFYQRQFLSMTSNPYDLVCCAYSLSEMPSAKHRLRTVLNLWNKTKDFLVLVEYGSNAGYKIICEARDFILQTQTDDKAGHVFAPCSHDLDCPRYILDETPCNFEVSFEFNNIEKKVKSGKELYSYVVLRKGKRPESDPQWPRIVRNVLPKTGHVICRMCCSDGKIKELIVTRKHGKLEYRCAKASRWGDLMPVNLKEIDRTDISKMNESDPTNEQSVSESESSNEESREKLL